jgi:hypothetical protein
VVFSVGRRGTLEDVTAKEKLRRAVDDLSEQEAEAALEYFASHKDPLVRAVEIAPEDDEPFTEADAAAVDEGHADLAAGRTITLDEFERRHG